ncbi:D-allose transporter subunit [Maliponia aquimaris]|uniref:D-allose transporter subunit n=1 Tax=Maliponia aquimaris TaxID=1673631 RepID=A0A238K4X3_9RHOB|nr:D-allose transporter subunit [Maliponia aquimaris]
MMNKRTFLKSTAAGAVLFLSGIAPAAADIGDVRHPLWYEAPTERTLELAKIDDLSQTVVSLGPRGEDGVLYSEIEITEEQKEKIRAGNFTAAISLGWLGDDWASQQLLGLKETFADLGIEVVAETNANWEDARQISDLDAISVLKPDLVVSIPLNTATTASAYKRLADAGSKIVFIDQAADGMQPGENYVSVISSDNLALGMYLADLLNDAVGGEGDVAAMYYANDFHVTNLRYIGFIARLMAKYPDLDLIAAAGHDNPNKGQEVAQALLARYPTLKGVYGSWSIPAMGAATAARINGKRPADFKIVNENFDQIVAADMAANGYIAGISTQQPYTQGATEAKAGALALIGESLPSYISVPPVRVSRDNLAEAYEKIYRIPLPAVMSKDLQSN